MCWVENGPSCPPRDINLALERPFCHNRVMSKAMIVPKSVEWGVYLFVTDEGVPLHNDEGEYLSVNGWKGDQRKIDAMIDAAAALGYEEGQVVFAAGRVQATRSYWEDQMEAFREGEEIPGDVD